MHDTERPQETGEGPAPNGDPPPQAAWQGEGPEDGLWPEDESQQPAAPGRRYVAGCFKATATGCLTVALLLAVLGYLVFRNVRAVSAELVRGRVVEIVEASGLPEDQQAGILGQVDRVAEKFKAGELSVEDVQRLAAAVVEGPLVPLARLVVAEEKYVQASGWGEERKRSAALAVQRFARGLAEGSIPISAAHSLEEHYTWTTPEGDPRMMESLSEEELLALLAEAEEAADAAGVPEEPYRPDIAAKVAETVDEFLAQGAE